MRRESHVRGNGKEPGSCRRRGRESCAGGGCTCRGMGRATRGMPGGGGVGGACRMGVEA